MLGLILSVASISVLSSVCVAEYPAPPATLDPLPYTDWIRKSSFSRLALVNVPFVDGNGNADNVKMYRLDLVGEGYSRGYDHGFLLAEEIRQFADVELNKYYMDMILNFDTSGIPEPIKTKIDIAKAEGKEAFAAAINSALDYIYGIQEKYTPDYILQEMQAIADGMCAKLGSDCDAAEWYGVIARANLLPELIHMACTEVGAWGNATTTGKLQQIRALDFGGGPFANYTVIQTHRKVPKSEGNNFVAVSFPGFVGVVTGIADGGIGISEKVWETYDKISLQPGTYSGEADVFVLRDILQKANTREQAEAYVKSANRTWAMFIGIGDGESQKMDIVGYKHTSAKVYDDETMPSMTGQPFMDSICYVDKHPQPSHDDSLPTVLADYYGKLSLETMPVVTQYHKTGDLHIAMYDYDLSKREMIVSVGRINEEGEYGPVGGDTSTWKAYNRPFVSHKLDDLFSGI